MKAFILILSIILFTGCASKVQGMKVSSNPLAKVDDCRLHLVVNGFSNPFKTVCPKNTRAQVYKVTPRR